MEKVPFEEFFTENTVELWGFSTARLDHFLNYMDYMVRDSGRLSLLDLYNYFSVYGTNYEVLLPSCGTFKANRTVWTRDIFERSPISVEASSEPWDEPGSNYRDVFIFKVRLPEPICLV